MTVRQAFADILLVCLACLCPPGVAYIKTGKKDLTLSIILTVLGWAPGVFHAWYLILTNPESQRHLDTHHQTHKQHDPENPNPNQHHRTPIKDIESPTSSSSLRRSSDAAPVEMHPIELVRTPEAVTAVVRAPIEAREGAKVQGREKEREKARERERERERERRGPPAYEV